MTKRRSIAAALTALAALAALGVPSTPAYATPTGTTGPSAPAVAADTRPSSCPITGYVCGYVNTSYNTNQGYELNPARSRGTCEVVFYRNAWSSAWNSTRYTIKLFRNTSCTGTDYKTIAANDGRHQFSFFFGIYWDNSVDAVMY
jgi:hypothetical protein